MGFEMNTPILVVDDDPKIVSLVRMYLEREGFRVTTANDGRAALSAIDEAPPRLIVLDLMLPELDGMTVMRRVRERSAVPVVMLSARGSAADRVYGISEGADDYLPKPFSPAELVVRVKAVLRRAAPQRGGERGTLALHDLEVDLDRLEVRRDGHILTLTPAESGCSRPCS
jgi:two-component system, OmpR family, response regulator ResD